MGVLSLLVAVSGAIKVPNKRESQFQLFVSLNRLCKKRCYIYNMTVHHWKVNQFTENAAQPDITCEVDYWSLNDEDKKKSNCNNSGYLNHRTYKKKCIISEYVDNYVLINLLLPSPTSYIEDLSFSSVQFSSISSCAMNDTQDVGDSNIPLLSVVC